MSRRKALAFIKQNPDYPIIAIGEFDREEVDQITSIAKNCLCLIFEDIEYYGNNTVQPYHIEEAIKWAADKPDIVVACRAGISRSSAIAYVVEATRVGPEEALKIIDPQYHEPNKLVVETASKVLNNPEILNAYNQFKIKLWELL